MSFLVFGNVIIVASIYISICHDKQTTHLIVEKKSTLGMGK